MRPNDGDEGGGLGMVAVPDFPFLEWMEERSAISFLPRERRVVSDDGEGNGLGDSTSEGGGRSLFGRLGAAHRLTDTG